MEEHYVVGNIISIDGLKVTVLMKENTNMLTYFRNGVMYRGITIGEYVGIIRGPYKIVGKVEREYLEDKAKEAKEQAYGLERFLRKIELDIIGSFLGKEFEFGIRCFPMVYNEVVLLSEKEISSIIQGKKSDPSCLIDLGRSVQSQLPVKLSWDNLLNTHIGIFGNTGSGKSNTLAKIYTEVFKKEGGDISLSGKSNFLLIDFNGEYTGDKVIYEEKRTLELSTQKKDSPGKINISPEHFWDPETLSILFSATEKTQRPFLQAMLNYHVDQESHDIDTEKLTEDICSSFSNVFNGNNHKESLRLLNTVYKLIGLNIDDSSYYFDGETKYLIPWANYLWHTSQQTYYLEGDYINDKSREEISNNREKLKDVLRNNSIKRKICDLSTTDKLKIIVNLQLIYGLYYGHVQFDHINPLLQRIEGRSGFIDKIIEIGEESKESLVTVVSLRDCNTDAKKIIPLLLAKQKYTKHKERLSAGSKIEHTFHLIIDEAHNILSEQSKREEESWKDYRLEVFEELIKEGRKFGFYLTIASQRPYDISATIISQLHNYFLHRLVNENDLRMINNTINSLDSLSKRSIPTLAPGQCVISGTSFDLPLLVQVDRLCREEVPNSDNADLKDLWLKKDADEKTR